MGMLSDALALAKKAHKGQNRKFGDDQAFITHPIAVSGAVKGRDAKVVALLHDVPEETSWTLAALRERFPDHIVDAIDCLTKRDGEKYMDFVERSKANPLARRVKIADIKHNISTIPEGHGLISRWNKALEVLMRKER